MAQAIEVTEQTLSDVLASLGWTHRKSPNANAQGRVVRNERGQRVGLLTAQETWACLRRSGLIRFVDPDAEARFAANEQYYGEAA